MDFRKYYDLYKEAEENSAGDLKKYVDDKLADMEKRLEDAGKGKYNVIPSQMENRLAVIDIEKGSQAGVIAPKGKLISIPVIYGDQVSFAVQDDNGRTFGTVHSLPDGSMVNQFRVGPPRPGFKFKEVMGRDKSEDDENGLQVEPEEEPISATDDQATDLEDIKDTKDQLDDIERQMADTESAEELEDLQRRARDVMQNIDRYQADIGAPVGSPVGSPVRRPARKEDEEDTAVANQTIPF